jgi:hypothetical protein
VRRVLIPGATYSSASTPCASRCASCGSPRPAPVAMIYRLFVLLNGLYFYLTAKVLQVAGRRESFQTKRGLRLALTREGFVDVAFSRPDGRLIVEARSATTRSPVRMGLLHMPAGRSYSNHQSVMRALRCVRRVNRRLSHDESARRERVSNRPPAATTGQAEGVEAQRNTP